MKYYSENLACLNRSDEYVLINKKFKELGYERVDNCEEASIIVVYTCGSTEAFIKRSVSRVKDLEKKFSDKTIVVCGCSVVTAKKMFENDDIIKCSPTDFSDLEKFLKSEISRDILRNATVTQDYRTKNRQAIVVQKGCIRKCSYCGIWKAVGEIFSKNYNSIIDEVKKSVELGKFDLTLTGDCIADYGIDIDSNIMDLLEGICKVDERIRINVYDFHPRVFLSYRERLIKLAETKQLELIGVPIQSGSMVVLEKMRRSFNLDKFYEQMMEMKKSGVKFATDIIIGFPGETTDNFVETVKFLEKAKFYDVSVNAYTDLEGSESSKMADKVSKKDIMKRYMYILEKKISGINEEFFEYQISQLLNKM